MRLPSLLVWLVALSPVAWAEPALKHGNARLVLVGDSITGQSRNHPAGYAYQIEWALQQAYPGCHPDVVSLGGSGQGIQAWLNTEKRSRTEAFPLDVKGIEVKAALDQPADVLVIMLGMNDVLAPYVFDEPASWEQWTAHYRELVTALQGRAKPGITAVATATLCTEDVNSPKNHVMDQLNAHLKALAAEMHLLVLPTNATMRDVLRRGRQVRPDFHVTHDYVHPNEMGHLAIAMGMLKGLGEEKAAQAIEEQKLANRLSSSGKAPPAAPIAAPWLVAAGTIRKPWNEHSPMDAALFRGPVEEAIEKGGSPAEGPGRDLHWQLYRASVDFTGGNNPDSVDFAAVTHARNFEAGYGLRWVHSDRNRAVNVELSTQTFAGVMQLGVWLNGAPVYSGLLTAEPGKRKTVTGRLHAGWNALVFCLNHTAWQMQCTVHLSGVDGDSLDDLRYSAEPVKPADSDAAK